VLPRPFLRRLFARLHALEGSSAAIWINADVLGAQLQGVQQAQQVQEGRWAEVQHAAAHAGRLEALLQAQQVCCMALR